MENNGVLKNLKNDKGLYAMMNRWRIDPWFLESQNVFVTIFKGIGPFEVATSLLEILTYDVGTKLPNSWYSLDDYAWVALSSEASQSI